MTEASLEPTKQSSPEVGGLESCPVGTRRSGYCQELGPRAILSPLQPPTGLHFSAEAFLKGGLTSNLF